MICRYCSEELLEGQGPNGIGFKTRKRRRGPVTPTGLLTKSGELANEWECINRAGYITLHDPQ